MSKDYKKEQAETRKKLEPREVPVEEWDDHDRLFMQETTSNNRKARRNRMDFGKYIAKQNKIANKRKAAHNERNRRRKIAKV